MAHAASGLLRNGASVAVQRVHIIDFMRNNQTGTKPAFA
jgi:hypothetical protein